MLSEVVEVPSGQVPQNGLLAIDKGESNEKYKGSEVILVTHQPVKF